MAYKSNAIPVKSDSPIRIYEKGAPNTLFFFLGAEEGKKLAERTCFERLREELIARGVYISGGDAKRERPHLRSKHLYIVGFPEDGPPASQKNNASTTHVTPLEYIATLNRVEAEIALHRVHNAKEPAGGYRGEWKDVYKLGGEADYVRAMGIRRKLSRFDHQVRVTWNEAVSVDVPMRSPSPEVRGQASDNTKVHHAEYDYEGDFVMGASSPPKYDSDGDYRMASPTPSPPHFEPTPPGSPAPSASSLDSEGYEASSEYSTDDENDTVFPDENPYDRGTPEVESDADDDDYPQAIHHAHINDAPRQPELELAPPDRKRRVGWILWRGVREYNPAVDDPTEWQAEVLEGPLLKKQRRDDVLNGSDAYDQGFNRARKGKARATDQ